MYYTSQQKSLRQFKDTKPSPSTPTLEKSHAVGSLSFETAERNNRVRKGQREERLQGCLASISGLRVTKVLAHWLLYS